MRRWWFLTLGNNGQMCSAGNIVLSTRFKAGEHREFLGEAEY